ncbi:TPA: HTH domain-containing protein [Legionella pneumophila]|nr:hypothetical protein [Legionella pneumophila]HAU1284666.1 hypothetical protein [Legionella pneumophila]
MNTFKEIAYQILLEADKPLHSKEITALALKLGRLNSAGKTPDLTMNAELNVDINTKKEASRFVKVAPSVFTISQDMLLSSEINPLADKEYKTSPNISTQQKGHIAEARIAELITLYGDTTLSCYRPVSDDEGIDLIVKEKGSLKTIYLQIKSRFESNPSRSFSSTIRACNLHDHHAMAVIFCLFDTDAGDLCNQLWFVPACSLIKNAHKLQDGDFFGFVAGKRKRESNKWDEFLIDKRDLANQIIASIKRIS